MQENPKLIVGIGNPGLSYRYTRHNVGFLVVDELAQKHGVVFKKSARFKGLTCDFSVNRQKVFILKPETFVNLSGAALFAMMRFLNINICDVIVIVDDVNIPFAKVRMRLLGTSGGHNGLKSIEYYLKSQEFARLKIGIGRDSKMDLASFVLNKFTESEMIVVHQLCKDVCDVLDRWCFVSSSAAGEIIAQINEK